MRRTVTADFYNTFICHPCGILKAIFKSDSMATLLVPKIKQSQIDRN
jgi:hypothetical protein